MKGSCGILLLTALIAGTAYSLKCFSCSDSKSSDCTNVIKCEADEVFCMTNYTARRNSITVNLSRRAVNKAGTNAANKGVQQAKTNSSSKIAPRSIIKPKTNSTGKSQHQPKTNSSSKIAPRALLKAKTNSTRKSPKRPKTGSKTKNKNRTKTDPALKTVQRSIDQTSMKHAPNKEDVGLVSSAKCVQSCTPQYGPVVYTLCCNTPLCNKPKKLSFN
ncbi:uncharacterized protein [Pleurodeles waltl]|uniref:uncharacterized protein isoform X2 n=1 Tax=Pleurodeles waltl TaxID=8319 RepID=UPI0037094CEB